MKKSFVIFVFGFLLIQGVFALSSNIGEVYRPGETIVVEISGNILGAIAKEDVNLKRKNVNVPFEYDVERLGDDWFIWLVAPENENNYTLIIRDVETTVNGNPGVIDFEMNFSVLGDLVGYTVRPGAVFTADDFEIEIESRFDENIEIALSGIPGFEGTGILEPGENKLEFDISGVDGTQRLDLQIGDYLIPALILGEEIEEPRPRLRFKPGRIERTVVITEERLEYPIEVFNDGDLAVEGFAFEIGIPGIVVGGDFPGILEPGESFVTTLVIEEGLSADIGGDVLIRYGGFSEELPILISAINEEERDLIDPSGESFGEGGEVIEGYYCSELSGVICTAGETCQGNLEVSLDGACCLGSCSSGSARGEIGKLAGWGIAILVVALLIFVYRKYKKTKGSSSKELLRKRSEKSAGNKLAEKKKP